jgi:hypothetical protein
MALRWSTVLIRDGGCVTGRVGKFIYSHIAKLADSKMKRTFRYQNGDCLLNFVITDARTGQGYDAFGTHIFKQKETPVQAYWGMGNFGLHTPGNRGDVLLGGEYGVNGQTIVTVTKTRLDGIAVGDVIKFELFGEDEGNTEDKTKQEYSEEQKKVESKEIDKNYMILEMCTGMLLGGSIGHFIFGNMVAGMGVGVCLGLAIGVGIKKKE